MENNHEEIVADHEKEGDILLAIDLLKRFKIITEKFDFNTQYLICNVKYESIHLYSNEVGIIT